MEADFIEKGRPKPNGEYNGRRIGSWDIHDALDIHKWPCECCICGKRIVSSEGPLENYMLPTCDCVKSRLMHYFFEYVGRFSYVYCKSKNFEKLTRFYHKYTIYDINVDFKYRTGSSIDHYVNFDMVLYDENMTPYCVVEFEDCRKSDENMEFKRKYVLEYLHLPYIFVPISIDSFGNFVDFYLANIAVIDKIHGMALHKALGCFDKVVSDEVPVAL